MFVYRRIRDLREDNDKTQAQIAKILNMNEGEVKEGIKNGIIMMGNSIRVIKGRENKEANAVKIKVRPKAYKKQ